MKYFLHINKKVGLLWFRRLGWGMMAMVTLLVVWHSLGIDTPRSAVTKAALDALPLNYALAKYCTAPGATISEAQLRAAESALPFKLWYVRSSRVALEGEGIVNLTLRLEPIYDFEPFRSLGYTIKADSLLVLEGHCEENGRFRWRTDPARTTVPSQRLPLLLRSPDGENAGAWF